MYANTCRLAAVDNPLLPAVAVFDHVGDAGSVPVSASYVAILRVLIQQCSNSFLQKELAITIILTVQFMFLLVLNREWGATGLLIVVALLQVIPRKLIVR